MLCYREMKFRVMKVFAALCLGLMWGDSAMAQNNVVVDYNAPKQYIVAGVDVEGLTAFNKDQIIQLTGLREGMKITVPGEDVSNIVRRLWMQRYFEDVSLGIDHLSEKGDSAYFVVKITERPRISRFSFSGIKNSEEKDLRERLSFKRGAAYSEYMADASVDIIKRYYKEKGFHLCDVKVMTKKDTLIRGAIRVNFHITKGEKVKIKTITFEGNENVTDYKLMKSMKKTRDNRLMNFFKSKKYNEKEYPNDKNNLISTFNEAGFRDARIVKDSMYYVEPNRLEIDFKFDEGKRYYFRNVTWTGNSIYTAETLNEILKIQKGDVYDMVTMEKRLFGGGKQSDYDVSKLYRDNGYLFFNLQPVEVNIEGDSVDVEMRIVEGKPAYLDHIIINGNDLTNEKVVRRQLFTRPGYLFSQSDFERSIREISSMGQFDPEAISKEGGYSIIPNQLNNTVDIVYNVTEKPSSQLELSGGWGGNTFVATVGVSFNNFSTHRFFEKGAWRPVPLGDAQNLSFRFQTNGTYYTSLSASFTEPWLFGKKPTSLNVGVYYTRQTNSYIYLNMLTNDEFMEVFGASAGIGTRLKWPDSYFVLYNQLSWQTYRLQNWNYNFLFNTGISNNLAYTISLTRNSTDQQIYPRQGSELTLSLSLTPPYSLFRKSYTDATGKTHHVDKPSQVDYNTMTAAQRYRWIEYHKWSFKGSFFSKLVGDLVLMARAQFGYLGKYDSRSIAQGGLGYSPFEGFLVGGDGMSGYNTYGSEIISLRGYENYSLTPTSITPYSSGSAYTGNVYDKFTVELRYPVILQPQSTIYVLAFLEGGNCWADIREFNPFNIKRSAGVGVRVFLPMIGLLGVDWGYGFDDPAHGKSQFHFVIGQQF